jgi:cell wall-associated NlpC family hydrolase
MSAYDLIGMEYRLGADGSNREIDCIHLCYRVLADLGIPVPAFKQSWYETDAREILKDINAWGIRVSYPHYNGDILLLPDSYRGWAFGVVWQNGFLLINRLTNQVNWCPSSVVQPKRIYRYCPTRSS